LIQHSSSQADRIITGKIFPCTIKALKKVYLPVVISKKTSVIESFSDRAFQVQFKLTNGQRKRLSVDLGTRNL
jgi:hypothetical protein